MSDDSNVKKGTDYEQFVQAVYQDIIRAEGVDTINVQHNISLQGKSGCDHQIDVYWEFKLAGQIYKTAIECKALNKEVSIGRVRDFYGVLLDIPNLNGIFATKVGYQSGAKKYAEHYGISLKALREPTEADWHRRVKDIRLNFHVVIPEIKSLQPRVSPSFLKRIPEGEEIRFDAGVSTHEPIIFDRTGEAAISYEELRQNLPHGNEPLKCQAYFAPFPNHILRLGGRDIEIDGIDLVYDVDVHTESVVIRGGELVRAIVKDAQSGELIVVDKKSGARKARS